MTNREKVLNTQRDVYTRRINFSFTIPSNGITVTVNNDTFERVAMAIEASRVFVESRPPGGGIAGIYDPRSNTIYVPEVVGRVGRVMTVHEAVHASLDLVHITREQVPSGYNEAAAAIAGDFYALYTGLPESRRCGGPHTREISRVTRMITRSIHSGFGVNPTTLERLKNLIDAHPSYASIPQSFYDGDG